jgi:hypothetical protein
MKVTQIKNYAATSPDYLIIGTLSNVWRLTPLKIKSTVPSKILLEEKLQICYKISIGIDLEPILIG